MTTAEEFAKQIILYKDTILPSEQVGWVAMMIETYASLKVEEASIKVTEK